MSGTNASYSAKPGNSCPAPMTNAALIAIRDAGGLSKDCDYVVTDHVQGQLVAGTLIHLQAVDASTLSMHAQVFTPYDNVGWEGRYDIDAGLVSELRDNRSNIVIGAASVSAFDWGNPAYNNCRVEYSTWVVTYGSAIPMARVRVLDASIVDTSGMVGGSLTNVEISKASTATLTNANLTIANSTVTEGATLSADDYVAGGTGLFRLRLRSSTLVLGAGAGATALQSTTIEDGATASHTGAGAFTLNQSRVSNGALVNHASPGLFVANGSTVFGQLSSIAHQFGEIVLSGTEIGPQGRIMKNVATSTARLTANYCRIGSGGYVQHSGAGPLNLTSVVIQSQSYVISQAAADTTAGMNISYTSLFSASYISFSATAGSMAVNSTALEGTSSIVKTGAGNIVVNSTLLQSAGQIQLTGVRGLSVSSCALSAAGRCVAGAAGGAGVSDVMATTTIQDNGTVNFNATGAAANGLQYSSIRGLTAAVNFSGANTGTAASRLTVDNGVANFAGNTVAFSTILDIGVRDQGNFTVSGCSAAQDIRYSTVGSYSRWNMVGRTVAAQSLGIDLRSQGTFNQTGVAGNATNVSVVNGGSLTQNGGALTRAIKELNGTLTTGAFNHVDIYHRAPVNQTLTAANTARGRDAFNNTLI